MSTLIKVAIVAGIVAVVVAACRIDGYVELRRM